MIPKGKILGQSASLHFEKKSAELLRRPIKHNQTPESLHNLRKIPLFKYKIKWRYNIFFQNSIFGNNSKRSVAYTVKVTQFL